MSVCTGAYVLAKAGLLDGKTATTHHIALSRYAADFPEVAFKRGARFVDAGNISTAGGLTSGIDLALHVVERYFGRAVAEKTVTMLEYQGQGWTNPDSNVAFLRRPVSTDAHPLCPVCDMEVDKRTSPTEVYHGHRYYFCSDADKRRFDQSPGKFVEP
jgi:transcriptional regulator GlxA family with amidase domain